MPAGSTETYEAHRLLEKFGLVRVTRQAGRAANRRVASVGADGGRRALPDVVQLLPDGLRQDGYSTVADTLDSFSALCHESFATERHAIGSFAGHRDDLARGGLAAIDLLLNRQPSVS